MLIFYGQIMARYYLPLLYYEVYTTEGRAFKLLTEGGIGLIEYHL